MAKNFYITTTLPYVNAEPHIGHAMEFIRADTIARYKKLQDFDVFFNTGTDEHGQKIFQKATETNVDPQTYVDDYATRFKELLPTLNISPDVHFIRTTDKHHKEAAQEFWLRCQAKGDIYKKLYKIKYCIGCELEKTDSELENGRCIIHPNLEIEIREEENYFFRFSKYQQALLDFYKQNPDFVIPDFRFNEIKAFVDRGLEDFSCSRLKSKMSWGVPVPGDEDHVMYVWSDALVSYISTLGWPNSPVGTEGEDKSLFQQFWVEGTPTQYCGKDNLRQQSAMWQAMLMSADLPNSRNIIINGFVTSAGGQKMSKSLGNVISPFDVVNEYGTEALRYYVLRELSPFEDSPMTIESLKTAYNANLANGLGNLTSRIMKLASTHLDDPVDVEDKPMSHEYTASMEMFNIQKAMEVIWAEIGKIDARIQSKQPFKVIKENKEEGIKMITLLVQDLYSVAKMLEPMLPQTSERIQTLIRENKMPEVSLFLRKE